jgi:hypothetical protein
LAAGPPTASNAHTILGGKVNLYKRGDSDHWHCATFLKGKNHRKSTKEDSLSLAKEIAEDRYLLLRGQDRAGVLKTEKTFKKAADQFLKEYEIITEGHAIRLRLHLVPYFGEFGLSEIMPGKVQEYRMRRATTPSAGSLRKIKTSTDKPLIHKAPSRSTLHDEIVTLRLVLKTAIRHGWLSHLSPPYRMQGKIVHRP